MRVSKKIKSIALATAVVVPLSFMSPAFADVTEIRINPPKGFVVGQTEGAEFPLDSIEIDPEDQGKLCAIDIFAINGQSRHEGNKLVVRSNGQEAFVEGIEEVSDFSFEDIEEMVVGETLELGLIFGPDGQSSLKFEVELDCAEPQSGFLGTSETITNTTVELTESPAQVTPASALDESTTTTSAVQESGVLPSAAACTDAAGNAVVTTIAGAEADACATGCVDIGGVVVTDEATGETECQVAAGAAPAVAVTGNPVYTG